MTGTAVTPILIKSEYDSWVLSTLMNFMDCFENCCATSSTKANVAFENGHDGEETEITSPTGRGVWTR